MQLLLKHTVDFSKDFFKVHKHMDENLSSMDLTDENLIHRQIIFLHR